jgi:hypothetical protein
MGFRGRGQASSKPQAENAKPMAPFVTAKLFTATANETPPTIAVTAAVISSAIASPNKTEARSLIIRA